MLKVTKVWINKYASGKLLGFATIGMSLDGSDEVHMTWRDLKLFKGNDNGDMWVSLPTRKDEKGTLDEKGNVKYYPIITVAKSENKDGPGDNFLEHIRQEVVAAYKNFNGEERQTPKNKFNKPNNKSDDDSPADDGVPF